MKQISFRAINPAFVAGSITSAGQATAKIFLTLICLFWFGAISTRAIDHYLVPPGTAGVTPTPNYTSWETAATNIQWAVDVAANGETVLVTNGSYCVTDQITIANKITLKSVHGYSNTLVYADWPTHTTRCFYVANTGVVDGFTISNGHCCGNDNFFGGGGAFITTNGIMQNCYFINNVCSNAGRYAGGGGLLIKAGGLVSNCLFVSNITYWVTTNQSVGPGIYLLKGSVVNCTIVSNYGTKSGANGADGGGIYASKLASGSRWDNVISNCTITDNTASRGGGVLINNARVINTLISNNHAYGVGGGGVATYASNEIVNCTIVNNISDYAGGGIYMLQDTNNIVSDCVIAGNQAKSGSAGVYGGGGILVQWGGIVDRCRISNNLCSGAGGGGGITLTNGGILRNSLICNNTNTTGTGGGGLLMTGTTQSQVVVVNCTIVNNYSTNEGGGMVAMGSNNYIANCIIVSNRSYSNNYPDVYNRGDNSNNYWYSCANVPLAPLPPSQGNITNDPLFVDASASNWRLNGYSPCINTGINQSWMTNALDLDGKIRIRYGTVDIGAYEATYQGPLIQLQ